jgi:hypothetical protein
MARHELYVKSFLPRAHFIRSGSGADVHFYLKSPVPREVLKASKGSAKEFKRSSILLAKFMAVWLCAVEEEVTHRVRLGLMKSER